MPKSHCSPATLTRPKSRRTYWRSWRGWCLIPEILVKKLFDSLTDAQKKDVAFAWDHEDPKLGVLRTRVSNNWQITKPEIRSEYYTKDQQEICRAIYEGLFQPEWVKQIDKQLQ